MLDPAMNSVYIAAMILFTILTLAFGIGQWIRRDNERHRDGSYGLSQAKAKAKADLITNETRLRLESINKTKVDEFKRCDPEIEN